MVKIVWKKNLIITIAVTGLILLGSGGLSYWIYGDFQKAKEEEGNFKTQTSVFKAKRDRVASLEKEVITLRENVKEYVKILPDGSKVNDFADSLSGFADESQVFFTKLDDKASRSTGKKKEVFDRTTFHINLKGNMFQLLKFISLVEDYERFLRISEILIKAGDYDKDILKHEVRHECALKVETFVYNSNVGGSLTKIQNYDKKRDLLLPEIRSARNEISVEHYNYVENPTYRDPFIDPRTPADGEGAAVSKLNLDQQKAFISDISTKITEIKELLSTVQNSTHMALIRRMEIQNEVAEKISELTMDIKQSVEEEWISDPACKLKMDTEIMKEVDGLVKVRDGFMTETLPTISKRELLSYKEDLQQLYLEKNFVGCQKNYKILEAKLGPHIDALQADPEKGSIINDINSLVRCASNAEEFYTTCEIKISGIIIIFS